MNRTVWMTTSILSIIFAVSGIHHGIFEMLQNGKVIDTFIIQSIGPDQQRWMNGQEAFSILSTYFIAGISTILVSVAIIFWSLTSLHKNYGPPILILLFVMLTIVGGGVGFILFYIPVCLFSFRIRHPLLWMGRKHSERLAGKISGLWPYFLIFTSLLLLISIGISFFGIAGRSSSEISFFINSTLILAAILMLVTYYSAVIHDIYPKEAEVGSLN